MKRSQVLGKLAAFYRSVHDDKGNALGVYIVRCQCKMWLTSIYLKFGTGSHNFWQVARYFINF